MMLPKQTMRNYSTPESAYRGEITRLTIMECFVCVGAYVGIGIYFGTFKHVAIAMAFAPLMLFRTDVSVEWGLRTYEHPNRLHVRVFAIRGYMGLFVAFPFVCIVAVWGIAVRVVSILYWAVRMPIQTLKAMLQNWLRQSLCTDVFHLPELLPLETIQSESRQFPTFRRIVSALREGDSIAVKLVTTLFVVPLLLLGYLPSFAYRLSFKATSLAFASLIWVVRATLGSALSTKLRLERITKGELEKVRRALSGIIVTTLALKEFLAVGLIDASYIIAKFPSQQFIDIIVAPRGWPWWQVALGVDALLTFFLLFFADAALPRIEEGGSWSEGAVLVVVSVSSFIRAVSSLLVVSWFCYFAAMQVVPESVRALFAS